MVEASKACSACVFCKLCESQGRRAQVWSGPYGAQACPPQHPVQAGAGQQ